MKDFFKSNIEYKLLKYNNYPNWLRKIHDKNFYLYEVIQEKIDESAEK